jgi:hypothetical protein
MAFRYDETAGLRVLLRRDPARSPDSLSFLERYYERRKREEAA